MKTAERAQASRRLFTNLVVLLVFISMLGVLMVYFNNAEPELKSSLLKQVSRRMQDSAAQARWQWQAEGRPNAIMLVHYDQQGNETERRPLQVNRQGLARVDSNDEACERLWSVLLNTPARLDGFRVRSDFTQVPAQDKATAPVCRYSISGGSYFDYNIATGTTTFRD